MEDRNEEPKEGRLARIKSHVYDYRRVYIAGAGCFVVGCAAGVIFRERPEVVNIVDAFNLKYKSPTTTTVVTILERRECPAPIPIIDKLTGESYASIRRAAAVTGEKARVIAQDIHGSSTRFERLPDSVLA